MLTTVIETPVISLEKQDVSLHLVPAEQVEEVKKSGIDFFDIMEQLAKDRPYTDVIIGCITSLIVHESYNLNGPIYNPENLIKVSWDQVCNPERYFGGAGPKLTCLYLIYGPGIEPTDFDTSKPFALALFEQDMSEDDGIQCNPHFFVYDDGEENIATKENKSKVNQVLSWIRKSSYLHDIMLDNVDLRFKREVIKNFNYGSPQEFDVFNLAEKTIKHAITKVVINVPDTLYEDKLKETDLEVVISNTSTTYCQRYLKSVLGNTFCLREKDGDRLVAWHTFHKMGALGILFVLPEYRRMKLALAVTKDLILTALEEKHIAERIMYEKSGRQIHLPKFIWAKSNKLNLPSKTLIKPFAGPYEHSTIRATCVKTQLYN